MAAPPTTLTAGSLPYMEPQGLALFRQCLAQATVYLEYGCGGSTIQAAAQEGVKTIFCVDNDRRWIDQVYQVVRGLGTTCRLIHCDLGPIRSWGHPRDMSKFARFHTYAVAPWEAAQQAGSAPDLVLVDGRFRVACFLYTLACAQEGTTILFDDYGDRPQYHVVEEFCKPAAFAGRMARFEAGTIASTSKLMRRFAQYSVVPE